MKSTPARFWVIRDILKADALGTESLFIGPEPVCGIFKSIARSSAKVWAVNAHTQLSFAGQNNAKKLIRGSQRELKDRPLLLGKPQVFKYFAGVLCQRKGY